MGRRSLRAERGETVGTVHAKPRGQCFKRKHGTRLDGLTVQFLLHLAPPCSREPANSPACLPRLALAAVPRIRPLPLRFLHASLRASPLPWLPADPIDGKRALAMVRRNVSPSLFLTTTTVEDTWVTKLRECNEALRVELGAYRTRVAELEANSGNPLLARMATEDYVRVPDEVHVQGRL